MDSIEENAKALKKLKWKNTGKFVLVALCSINLVMWFVTVSVVAHRLKDMTSKQPIPSYNPAYMERLISRQKEQYRDVMEHYESLKSSYEGRINELVLELDEQKQSTEKLFSEMKDNVFHLSYKTDKRIVSLEATTSSYRISWRALVSKVHKYEGNGIKEDQISKYITSEEIYSGEGSGADASKDQSSAIEPNSQFGIPDFLIETIACRVGPEGQKGDTGSPGLVGEKGDVGSRGPRGEKGDHGIHGFPGQKGETGERGDRGEKGETGATGQPGYKGEPGVHGQQGEKGDKGYQGSPGAAGLTGRDGRDCQASESFTENQLQALLNYTAWNTVVAIREGGLKGEPGLNGLPGTNGIPGQDGASGRDGKDGTPGLRQFSDSQAQEILTYIQSHSSYGLHSYGSTWDNAKAACESHNQWLALIDVNELESLRKSGFQLPRRFWMNGRRSRYQPHWISGPWHHGEPNNRGNSEHCLEMNSMLGSGGQYGWNDANCDTHLPFLCTSLVKFHKDR